ncbi:MAG: OmpA family protein [Arenimonas sp.]|nr:OmpA family protein [Arenimonas sp.]
MKKKLLCCALLAGMSMAQSAMAQSYDDRFYVTAGGGVGFFDADRDVADNVYGQLGFGKFISPNISIDAELWHSNPDLNTPGVFGSGFPGTQVTERNWELMSLAVVGRYHFISEGRSWNPYLAFGLGAQEHHDGTQTQPLALGFNKSRVGTDAMALLGLGFQKEMGFASLRGEVGVRVDLDDEGTSNDYYTDGYVGFSFVLPIGPEAVAAAPPPPPPAKTCADLDDDGDGVNNCNDKCPGSQAGQAIGPDGCPVPLTIDLKGVNFDFDKDTLRPDAVAILDEAISILGKYPELKVEVAGHTDSVGTDEYNQKLSERRATTVFDYLTGHGIEAGRLVGPVGYGESKPIAPNANEDGSDNPEGRAKNRRTELNVQN